MLKKSVTLILDVITLLHIFEDEPYPITFLQTVLDINFKTKQI